MDKQILYIFNFSKFLIKLIAIISIIIYALNFSFEKFLIFNSEVGGASKINRILNINDKNEIPIFGSSRALQNFVPSIIDKKNCFNYGINGIGSNIWHHKSQ